MRSDYLNQNSNTAGGFKKKVGHLVSAVTLTNEDSGKVFTCDSAGGAYEITLPTSLEDGAILQYRSSDAKFVTRNELVTTTGTLTINAGSF